MVQQNFAQNGYPDPDRASVDTWQDVWTSSASWRIIRDKHVAGLDNGESAALLPRAWMRPPGKAAPGDYDPLTQADAIRARMGPWTTHEDSVLTFRHPQEWSVRFSSSGRIDAGDRAKLFVRFSFETYDGQYPELFVRLSTISPMAQGTPDWYTWGIGNAAIGGYGLRQRDGASLHTLDCRIVYLEREFAPFKPDIFPTYGATIVIACSRSGQEKLLATLTTPEYRDSGRPATAQKEIIDDFYRFLCSAEL